MNGFSTVDGFVVITECLAEMIKYVANEPSVGLYYVQQHTQNAVPNVVGLKHNIAEKSRETTLHTEDMEDSLAVVSSMKHCGFPIVDEMITDIRNSLTRMSRRKPRRGLIHNSTSSIQTGSTLSWGSTAWGRSSSYGNDGSNSYLSSVFKSATQKASILKWPQLNTVEQMSNRSQKPVPPLHPTPLLNDFASTASSIPETEADELPLSSEAVDELHLHEGGDKEKDDSDDVTLAHRSEFSVSEDFDDFKAGKEARLELWLEGTESKTKNVHGSGRSEKGLTSVICNRRDL